MGQSALPQLLDEFLLRLLIETWSFREDGRQGVPLARLCPQNWTTFGFCAARPKSLERKREKRERTEVKFMTY